MKSLSFFLLWHVFCTKLKQIKILIEYCYEFKNKYMSCGSLTTITFDLLYTTIHARFFHKTKCTVMEKQSLLRGDEVVQYSRHVPHISCVTKQLKYGKTDIIFKIWMLTAHAARGRRDHVGSELITVAGLPPQHRETC